MKASPTQTKAGVRAEAASTGEEAAGANLKQFVDLFELAPIAYLSLGPDRTVRMANRAAAELLGRDRASLQGADFDAMVDGAFREEFDASLGKLLATGVVQTLYLQLSRESAPRASVSLMASLGAGEGECLLAMIEIGARQLEAENQLLALKERHRSLNRMSQNFYWTSDAEHRIKKMSLISRDTGKAFLQHAPTTGMRRWEAPYLSPGEEAWAAHRETLDARQPFRNFELSRLGLDGTEHFFAISGDPLFDAYGEFLGYHGLGRDITERKRGERTLRESEERYRSLFANAGDGILILSEDGSIVAANAAFARMHGYGVQEILELPLKNLLVPEDWSLAPERWRRALGGERLTLEVDHVHKNGHVFRVEVSSNRVSVGNVTYIQTFHRDITERRLAERAVRESEERFRNLFANAGDGIMIVSQDRRIVAYNQAFARMHGYGVEEMANIELKRLLTPKTYEEGPQRWRRLISEKRMTMEVEHYHKDGHIFPVEIVASLIDSAGELLIQTFYRDITERKHAETALLRAIMAAQNANRAKTRFLAAASHDLRQPVQAINLFLDALAQSQPSEEQKEILHYLGMSVRGLRELLNVLLDISQLDAGAVKPEASAISVEKLLRDLESEFAPIAGGRNLRLKRFVGRDLTLLADPGLLLRALRNIVGNALKYTERGGILLAARRRGAYGVLQVWDTGIGIAPQDLGRVFEEYFQIGNNARDRNKGLGLGLSIVERLIRLIDGRISCSSRPGRGTVFEIRLPLALGPSKEDASASSTSPAAGAAGLLRFAGRHIVVVEDDSLVAKSLEQALGALGASVTTFCSAEEALVSDSSLGAELYISDFRLPGALNGMQFLAVMQQRSAAPINAVLMTGDTALNQTELSASSRWKVLFKPIDLRALLAAI